MCSMSAMGQCGENAACEGFFGLLKREQIYRMTYPTLEGARADVFEYIERFRNPRRQRRATRQDQKFSALLQPTVISGQNPYLFRNARYWRGLGCLNSPILLSHLNHYYTSHQHHRQERNE